MSYSMSIKRIWCWVVNHKWFRYDLGYQEEGKQKTRRLFRCHRCGLDKFDLFTGDMR